MICCMAVNRFVHQCPGLDLGFQRLRLYIEHARVPSLCKILPKEHKENFELAVTIRCKIIT